MEYKDYAITVINNPNSWNGIKTIEARKNYDEVTFDYFYLNGIPLGNGRFDPFLNQDEAEKTVQDYIDNRTDDDIIHEHYNILIKWNKKFENLLTASQKAFESGNIDEAINIIEDIGVIKIKLDEHWRRSLLGHLKQYKKNSQRV